MYDQIHIQLLIERVALFNDEKAYKEIFFLFYKDIKRFSFSFLKSNEAAEEIASDVFINLWKNRSKLLDIGNFKVYLYVAAKNLSIRYISRSNKKKMLSLDDLSFELRSYSNNATPEDLMISEELANKIKSAIENLPARCKIIYQLVREDGLRYKEAAAILNISIKTIDAQMCIATKKICEAVKFDLKSTSRI